MISVKFDIGDLVTRKSYNHDLVFIVTDIIDGTYYLKGSNVRLYADSPEEDLDEYLDDEPDADEEKFMERIKPKNDLNRTDYFYLPGKILHIDGDKDYLNKCLKYYDEANIWAMGICEKEENIAMYIKEWLQEYRPNIVIITGHDAYYKRMGEKNDLSSYKNSSSFVEAVREARKYEQSHDKLIVIAGACQSDYEELIKAGANFASSPKRINIHALDPAIIATKMSLSDINKDIDLKKILEQTKYGSNGIGGIITKGTMYIGYPR